MKQTGTRLLQRSPVERMRLQCLWEHAACKYGNIRERTGIQKALHLSSRRHVKWDDSWFRPASEPRPGSFSDLTSDGFEGEIVKGSLSRGQGTKASLRFPLTLAVSTHVCLCCLLQAGLGRRAGANFLPGEVAKRHSSAPDKSFAKHGITEAHPSP